MQANAGTFRRIAKNIGDSDIGNKRIEFGPFYPGEVVDSFTIVGHGGPAALAAGTGDVEYIGSGFITIAAFARPLAAAGSLASGVQPVVFAQEVSTPNRPGIPQTFPLGFVAGFAGMYYLVFAIDGYGADGSIWLSVSRKEWMTPVPQPEEEVL